MTMGRDAERGFTLTEMIVVVAVLGLVLALVITHGPARSQRLELDAAARQVSGALRLARSRAVADERTVMVTFGPGAYRLDGDAPIVLPQDVLLAGDGMVRFTPDGASSGARIVLHNGDRQIMLGVDWLTGRVQLRKPR
jgi:prepilin-type N-terminal cleavage/methylation domain-containing protein